MGFYEESANGEEYRDSKGKWHVKQSVIDYEKDSYEARHKLGGSLRIINNNSNHYHQTAIARDINNVKKRRS